MDHIHCIGIGWIGISALARYYHALGFRVTGTEMAQGSQLLADLQNEGIEIVDNGASVISAQTKKVIYTEAIIDDDTLGLDWVRELHRPEVEAGRQVWAEILSYPEALAQIFNAYAMKIAVAGAHGKSTTSAMIGTILHNAIEQEQEQEQGRNVNRGKKLEQGRAYKICQSHSNSHREDLHLVPSPFGRGQGEGCKEGKFGATTIVGTLVKAFGGKNISIERAPSPFGGGVSESHSEWLGWGPAMVIEACEYRNAFLHYHPDIAVITNIDPDHLDFFKTAEAYEEAFYTFMGQARCVVMLASEIDLFFPPLLEGGCRAPARRGDFYLKGWNISYNYTEIPYRKDLRLKARELRKNMTGPEKLLWKYLLRNDDLRKYRFLRQKPLWNYIVDFYCHELWLVIEIDWISHLGQEIYDKKRDQELMSYWLTILHITNDQILTWINETCEELVLKVKNLEKEFNQLTENKILSQAIHDSHRLTAPSRRSVPEPRRMPLTLVSVHPDYFELTWEPFNGLNPGKYPFILPSLLVPWDHIRLDASLAYTVSQLLHLDSHQSIQSLQEYPGSWRRMEIVGTTSHANLLMSDYGHHPTEIRATLKALRESYISWENRKQKTQNTEELELCPLDKGEIKGGLAWNTFKQLIAFFEPHQYSRTYELREEFATCFADADMVYISDIYAARDIDESRDSIDAKILADMVAKHSKCEYVGTLDDARAKLLEIDTTQKNTLILLLGAGNIDELRSIISKK